ncbi:MAG TPA: chemotaxis protein CheB, partial [Ilumatobacteraceae bacterium]
DPELHIVGEAADGKQAIELCSALHPDVISMDMMLPVMSGLAATEYVMAHFPTPILVVSASWNRGELFKTYEALAAGAVDVLEKPSGHEPEGAWEARYLASIKMVSRIKVITHPRARLNYPVARHEQIMAPLRERSGTKFSVVAIGASTGGPSAIVDVLRGLPDTFNVPVLFVLHIGEPFGTAFADWLDGQTSRRVAYARDGETVASASGRVVMAPPDRHLVVDGGRMRLTKEPERHSCRPSVDVLFESIARQYGPSAIGCLLTGMGRDGASGLGAIRAAGGATIAQDEASSVVYGMPREAALIGAAESVLPLQHIATAVCRLAQDAENGR